MFVAERGSARGSHPDSKISVLEAAENELYLLDFMSFSPDSSSHEVKHNISNTVERSDR